MPASSSLFRSIYTKNDPDKLPYVPDYAVLFWHAPDGLWGKTTTENGSFDGAYNPQYYRRFESVSRFPAYNDPKVVSYPVVKCVADDASWTTETGKLEDPFVSIANTVATLLEVAGPHNPLTMLRTNIYTTSGFAAGDTASTNLTYVYKEKTGSQAGHSHFVDNVRDLIYSINYGNYKNTVNTDAQYVPSGMQTLQVDLLIRDPKLSGADKKLNWLPKNVIVFGSTLPDPYYVRTDVLTASNQKLADGKKYLPLLAKHPHVGVEGDDAELITFYGSSSFSNNHTHDKLPVANKSLSNKTNQTGYLYLPAGAHNHVVEYKVETFIKSKLLKAWVTTEDKTPIADGVILALAIGPGTGYSGSFDNSDILPPNWHFCDGTNGTPDLRDYYVMANFADSDHDVINSPGNEATVVSITTSANGNHSHYSAGPFTGFNGTMIDIGGHGFEDSLNHTHTVSVQPSFKKRPTDSTNVTNFRNLFEFEYAPPTVSLAFIMYNENIE